MAAAGEIQALCEEATCPICLEFFTDPVTIAECGHNFCQTCLTRYWGEEEGADASCPQCRETVQDRNLVPNRPLANVVEITKKLSLQGQRRGREERVCEKPQELQKLCLQGQRRVREGEPVCEKHQEPLKLFCRDHEAPICLVCDRSQEHEGHKVIPREEAFQEYKDQIQSNLKILRAEREKILTYIADAEKESQDLLNQMEEERQKTLDGFRQIHQFLEEQEKILLAQIDGVEKEIARRRDEDVDRLFRELSSLETIIQEMEEKCQQPASEFLQDVRSTLQRYEKKEAFENPVVALPLELTCRIWEFRDVRAILKGVTKQFAANVTLDPDTAHPQLLLSEDRKSARLAHRHQAGPDNPERFDFWPFVLGSEGFAVGRHFWNVDVGNEEGWAVGVARMSVRRKGWFTYCPEEGIWAVEKWNGQYKVFSALDNIQLFLSHELKRIRVTLNCDEGQVAFSDADTGVEIYTFSGASFFGETLFPFFRLLCKAHLRLNS